jgi:hypothetical protein
MPNNREWASLLWLAALGGWVLLRRDTRAGMQSVIRLLVHPKLLLPLVGMALWVAGVVAVGWLAGAWSPRQTTDTAFWFAGSGLALLFSIDRSWENRHFFRHSLAATVKISVFVAFYVGLADLPLWSEMLIQPLIVFLVLVSIAAGTKEEYASVKRAIDRLIGVAGFSVLIGVGVYLVSAWRHIHPTDSGLDFALPIWLTLGVLPFVWIVGVYATYESLFVRLQFTASDRRVATRARWAALLGLRGRVGLVGRFGAPWLYQLANAESLSEALSIVRRYRAEDKQAAETDQHDTGDL